MPDINEILSKVGVHIDDLNRLRLLAPDAWETTSTLEHESKEFVGNVASFNKSVDNLIVTFEELAALVEAEKLRAMTLRNELKSADKRRVSESQQIQVLIRQRQVELERLKAELAAAQRVEAEQRDFIQKFISA